jgi:hypothetical protein
MKAKIVSVHGHGRAMEEYLLMEILQDCDLGAYAVVDYTYRVDHELSNMHQHFYRFEPKKVRKGDQVLLWTRGGKNSESDGDSGRAIYQYYWGLVSAVWNDDGDVAQLLQIGGAQQFVVSKTPI